MRPRQQIPRISEPANDSLHFQAYRRPAVRELRKLLNTASTAECQSVEVAEFAELLTAQA